jgi:hypothetical protein
VGVLFQLESWVEKEWKEVKWLPKFLSREQKWHIPAPRPRTPVTQHRNYSPVVAIYHFPDSLS